jgi:hypothetical protein
MQWVSPRLCEHLAKSDCLVIFSSPAKRVTEKNLEEDKTLVITDMFLGLYSEDSALQELKFPWIDVTHYSFQSEIIELTNPEFSVRFRSPAILEIQNLILRILEGCLPLPFFQSIGVPPSHRDPPASIALLGRYKVLCGRQRSAPNDSVLSHLTRFAESGAPFFSTKHLQQWEAVVIPLFESLAVCRTLETIEIRSSDPKYDYLPDLLQVWPRFSTLRHIVLIDPQPHRFKEFALELRRAAVCALTVKGVLSSLADLQRLPLSSIALRRPGVRPALLFDFVASCGSQLQYLALDYIPSISVKDLAPHLSRVKVLSLKGCDLAIGGALAALSGVIGLRILRLSKNRGVFRSALRNLLPGLLRLDVAAVTWDSISLRGFLGFVRTNWGRNFYLDMARSQIDGDATSVTLLDAFRSVSQFAISAFCWDDGPISPEFVGFLVRCPALSTLVLRNALDKSPSLAIRAFAKGIPEMQALTQLIITGCGGAAQVELLPVLSALERAPRLASVDISGNRIGEEGHRIMSQVIRRNRAIKTVAFDCCACPSLETLDQVIAAAEAVAPFLLIYPTQTIESFKLQSGTQLKRRFVRLQGGLCSDAEIPFQVKTVGNNTDFPVYFSPEIERLCATSNRWLYVQFRRWETESVVRTTRFIVGWSCSSEKFVRRSVFVIRSRGRGRCIAMASEERT